MDRSKKTPEAKFSEFVPRSGGAPIRLPARARLEMVNASKWVHCRILNWSDLENADEGDGDE